MVQNECCDILEQQGQKVVHGLDGQTCQYASMELQCTSVEKLKWMYPQILTTCFEDDEG